MPHRSIPAIYPVLAACLLTAASCSRDADLPAALPPEAADESAAVWPEPVPEVEPAPAVTPAALDVRTGLTYAVCGDAALKLDLALPPAGVGVAPARPAIIYVHGGGFVAGSRSGFAGHIVRAAERGYVAAAVDYRLADGRSENKFPAAVMDVAAAVRWLKTNASAYGVDPERIGLYGGSAGGNLALMVGLAPEMADEQADRLYPDVDSRVAAVVNYCGPVDYAVMLKNRDRVDPLHVLKYLKGGSVKQVRRSAEAASPLNYVDAGDPPVLTLHGNRDRIVPYANAVRLDEAMRAAGLRHRLVTLEGADHPGLSEHNKQYRQTLLDESFDFFDTHLKP